VKLLTKEQTFIIDELWILAWAASVQRANVFVEGAQNKAEFRKQLVDHIIEKILPLYKERCTDQQHNQNIAGLVKFAEQIKPSPLRGRVYKYGVAQKLLNLSLKYYWCFGLIPEPPHCPVDRIIIAKTHLRKKVNWTEIRNKDEYSRVIEAIRKVADGESLARWELSNYERLHLGKVTLRTNPYEATSKK